jgi:1-phosphatidylinositol-4-phosphate 5-kinase
MTTAYGKFEQTINWILGVQNKNHREIEKSKIENYDKKSVFKFNGFSNSFFNKNKQGDEIEKGKPEEQKPPLEQEPKEQEPKEEETKKDEQKKTEQEKPEEEKTEEEKPEEEKPKYSKNTKKEYDERRKIEYGNKI